MYFPVLGQVCAPLLAAAHFFGGLAELLFEVLGQFRCPLREEGGDGIEEVLVGEVGAFLLFFALRLQHGEFSI